ncbi:beta strand repeat-containing protein [Tunturibacter empetritectus]|uniref:beta strand repeat-containing protein n=1 Tax=Tunturiibacter empetritectus TaxID=3069691 RepID=UPI003872CAA5
MSLRFRISHFFPLSLFGLFAILGGCSSGSGNSGGGGSQQKTPAPIVTGISPSSVPVGSPAFTLSITGSNFQPQAVVNWNTTALATTFTSASALSAAVPANLAATGSTANITVTNPDGQSTTGNTSSQQVSITNPAPTLSGVTPQLLYAGSPNTVFTLTGTNFNSSSVVMAGTTSLTTTFVSATQLTASAPAALLATVGTLSLAVLNPAPGGGSSQTIPVTLSQPPATLASLSPATATAGSSPVNVTLTGTYFTPTSVVYINNYLAAATTYISSTSIQFTISAQALTSTGNLIVTVHDSAWPNNISNQLMFQVVNPVPVLSSISPVSITAGAPNFYLTLSGSNFVSSSTVLINGAPTQPDSSSGTTATVIVPASAVSTVGTVTIAVSNPAPGGGTSASQTLNVISANNRIRTVNIEAADLGWDPAHNLLIASTLSGSSNNANSIVTIDPLQGTVITAASLPSQPSGISVTADGSYVYVTLPSTGQIERFTLPSLTPDITFGLGSANGKPNSATSVASAPGEPHTVGVSLQNASVNSSVAVFDDGVVRSNIAVPTGFDNNFNTLVWGSDATTLYGSNAIISTADEDTFSVNNSGVTLHSDQPGALGEFVRHLAFDTKTGRLVDGYGDVVTAASGQNVGQLQVQNTIGYEENPFALDTAQRTVFYLNVNGFYPNGPVNGTYIQAFGLDQFNYINSMLVNGLTGGSTIVRWGTSGLAINGSSQIYLIDGSFIAPTGISSPAGGYVAPSPTLISVTPAAVTAGSADVKFTLTGRDFTQSSQVTWNNQTLLIDSVSDTQIVATIPASSLTSPVASGIAATNGVGTASSGALGFTVLPDLGPGTQINTLDISGQDLAWDSKHNLLYVAVPGSDPVFPNTIAVVDPTKPTLTQAVPIADNPSVISLSDDNQYLYSGFYGQAIIQRYALPSFSLDLTIPTGVGYPANTVGTHGSCTFATEVKVAPGNPQSIAVTSGNNNVEPRGCGNLAIYDSATPRPGFVVYGSGAFDFSTLAWGADTTTLYGQSDYGGQPQSLGGFAVSSTGVTVAGALNSGNLGLRVHFDPGTNLIYSDSGVITNPVGPAQVGTFPSGVAVVTDSTLKRAFVLSSSSSNNSGQGATSYTLNIFDLNTRGLLNSIVIPDVLGYPTRMARWGSNGLAFVTNSQLYTTGSAGVLYILQGSGISGLP